LNKIYIFDACALIALLTEENGYRNVEKIIEESKNNRAQIIMHNVNLLEVYYDIYKLYDETSAIKFLDEIKNAPIKLVAEVNNDIIINPGRLKRKYKISLADSIGLAEAIISNGTFVTSDHHELDEIEKNEKIDFTWIR
jgi:PIN domain nuclease of toxin-antitoxin system